MELEKSATIRETGHVPITGKVIVFVFFSFSFSNLGIEYNLGFVGGIIVSVQTKRKEDQDREREFTRPYACQSPISHHHQTQ